jgi:DNA-binding MarR family transcriptional regulator
VAAQEVAVTSEVVRRRDEAAGRSGRAGEPFVVEESLGYLVNYLARAFTRALAEALAPHGVAPAQWAVLLILWAEDGLAQTELSRRVAVEEPTMVRTLDRMERDGLVRRERDPHDRRRSRVVLTERGHALRDVLVPGAVAVNAVAQRALTPEERRRLPELLRRLITAFEGEPPPRAERDRP